MGLTAPLALALLAAIAPAWWLARRGGGRARVHALWFLVEARGASVAPARRTVRSRWLLVAAIAVLAVAAAGPVRVAPGTRALVVDLSATRALDLDDARRAAARADVVIAVSPGVPPRRLDDPSALTPSAGTVDGAELAAGIALAAGAARTVEVLAAPPLGDDAGIASATFQRDPLAAERGQLSIVVRRSGAAAPTGVVVRGADGAVRGGVALERDEEAVAIPYEGRGDELVTVEIQPGDELAIDDAAVVEIPALLPTAVWIDPALAASPLARAVAVLPTAVRIDAPRADAIAIVSSTAWRGAARAIVIAAPAAGAHEPLLAVPGAPLPGVSASLLAAAPAVDVDPAAGADVEPARVWLRAGPHAAVFVTELDGRPALRLAAVLDGAVLPILLADALATPPLAAPPRAIVQPDVRAPVGAIAPPSTPDRAPWPTRLLLIVAALLIAIEAAIARRPRRLLIAAAVAALAIVAIARTGRRVVFVVDASASVAPAEADARAAVARRAGALAPIDRAAVVVVAGGARVAVPLGDPAAVQAWAHRPLDARALGLDPGRTDLGAGLAAADALLGAGPGTIVVVGDGRDTEGGAQTSPARARGVALEPIDAGDLARVELPATALTAAPGRPFALDVIVETRLATSIALTVAERGRALAHRDVAVAAGRTALTIPVTLDASGRAVLDVTIAAAGDPIAASDHARAIVRVAGPPRVVRVTAADVGVLTAPALADVDAVILDDVPAPALSSQAVDAIDALVRGGGTLLWSAGPAVEAGGEGAIAPLLPLRDPRVTPVALELVVDRSGSIDAAGVRGAVPDAAALGAVAAALDAGDRFGAIAFDVAPIEWRPLAPIGEAFDLPPLPEARGGTDPARALALAGDRLAAEPGRRVVALVTDGGFAAAEARTLDAARRLAGAGIRVEVVGVGDVDDDARARLTAVATAGGGRLHMLDEGGLAGAVPSLRVPPPATVGPAPARARGTWSGSPLTGEVSRHVARAPTSDAVILADVGDDPLLAVRGHGAGRVLAWTADLGGAWIDPAIAASVLAEASRPRASASELIVRPGGAMRSTIELRGAAVRRAPRVAIGKKDGSQFFVGMIPSGVDRWSATFAADVGTLTIDVAGAHAELELADPEQRALGVDSSTETPSIWTSPSPRPSGWMPSAIAMAIGALLITLALPRARSVEVALG